MTSPSTTGVPEGRYGGPPRVGRRARVAVVVTLAATAVGVAAWFALAADRPVTWQVIGYTVRDDAVEVVFDVHRPDPDVVVRCTVQALDERFGQVGVVDVEVPATTDRDARVTASVVTTQLAVTGVVEHCEPA